MSSLRGAEGAEGLRDELRALVAQVLEIPAADVSAGLEMERTPAWTSLRHLMLIAQVEDRFRIRFTAEEVSSIRSYGALVDTVRRHRGDR